MLHRLFIHFPRSKKYSPSWKNTSQRISWRYIRPTLAMLFTEIEVCGTDRKWLLSSNGWHSTRFRVVCVAVFFLLRWLGETATPICTRPVKCEVLSLLEVNIRWYRAGASKVDRWLPLHHNESASSKAFSWCDEKGYEIMINQLFISMSHSPISLRTSWIRLLHLCWQDPH